MQDSEDKRMTGSQEKISRRGALRHLSAGSLLTLGLWPGCVHASDSSSFRFLVINDTHYMSPECGVWLEAVVRQMKTHGKVEFCLFAGDLTDLGRREHFAAVHDIFRGLGVPFFVVIGNHDYSAQDDRSAYRAFFPNQINYRFQHRGWQFVGLDTTEGLRYEGTTIQAATFQWLDEQLPKMDKQRPMVILTHFPLGPDVTYRPRNADDLLDRFRAYNLQAVFSGHFHGFTERKVGHAALTTNRCCALKRANHDKTREKGYFLCTASEGRIVRTFVEHKAT
jgi:predicted MPP superfamily phosphohydrolase